MYAVHGDTEAVSRIGVTCTVGDWRGHRRWVKFTAIVVEDDPGALHWNGDAGSALPVAAQDHTVLRIWEMNPGFQGYLLARCNFEKALGYAYIMDT